MGCPQCSKEANPNTQVFLNIACVMFAGISLAKSAHMAKPMASVGRDTQGQAKWEGSFCYYNNLQQHMLKQRDSLFLVIISTLLIRSWNSQSWIFLWLHFMLSEISGMPEGFSTHNAQRKFLPHSPSFPLPLTHREVVSWYLFSPVAVTNDHM